MTTKEQTFANYCKLMHMAQNECDSRDRKMAREVMAYAVEIANRACTGYRADGSADIDPITPARFYELQQRAAVNKAIEFGLLK